MSMPRHSPALAGLAVVGLGCVLRLLWLEADPDYLGWQGFVTDEGRWIENARSLHLFGEPLIANSNLHLAMAPLYQTISFAVFAVADVGRASARSLPALCGSALVLCFWLALRRKVAPIALGAAALLLATQEDLLMLSRVSVPEVPAMLLQWLAFVTLMTTEARRHRLVAAGALATVAVGLKATTAPFVVVLALLAWGLEGGTPGVRLRRCFAFAAVPVGAAVVLMLLAVSLGFVSPASAPRDVATIVGFVRLADAYSIAAFALHAPLAATIYVWALAPWIASLVVLSNASSIDMGTRRWLIGATVWAVSYVPLAALLGYYPARYQAHALVPMAALVALSVHIVLSARDVSAQVRPEPGPWRRAALAATLALPPAVLVTAFATGSASLVFAWADALTVRLLGLSLAWAVLTWVLRNPGVGVTRIAAASVAATLAWYAGYRLAGWQFWLPLDAASWSAQWAIMAASAAAAVLARPRLQQRAAIVAVAGTVALASALPYAGMLLTPAFTLRDASRDLGVFLSARSVIVSDGTEGLFVDNRLPFASRYRLSEPMPPGAALVRLEHGGRPLKPPPAGWVEARRYTLDMSSRYTGGPLHVVVWQDAGRHD